MRAFLFEASLLGKILISLTADPGATMTFVAGGALKPIGGHILSHASATRLFLRKGRLAREWKQMQARATVILVCTNAILDCN